MPVASLKEVNLAFGHVSLLDHVDVVLQPGERVGLIGRNGTGKSSLLKVLAGQMGVDDGEVWREAGLKVALVPQEPDFDPAHSVFRAAVAGSGPLATVLEEYHQLVARGEHADLDRLHAVQQAIDHGDGWRLEGRVERMLETLGLNPDVAVTALSGGAQKRLALAQALVQEPDLLLLDEPTNHLDIDGIRWLEELLLAFGGTVLLITHDRRFLDAVATRIVELDRGRLASFPGSYARYVERKAEMLDAEAKADARFDKLLAQEEVWIRKGIEARRTRNMGRVARLERLRRERAERRERMGKVNLGVERGDASGKLVAELEGVSKRFGERTVVRDFSTRILRGDRIGLIGPNGVGKSTLIRLILGELPPDGGKLRLGTRLSVAYFDQMRTQLDEDATLAEVISPGSDYVERAGQRQHVIGYLGDFLFAPERARSPVRTLSGGERNRLLLARLFARPANLIVLDEPTNDLDIETLELLEALLQDFDGTLLLVSHDRAFLDNVVTQTIAYEGEGRWKEYVGGYSDWESQRSRASLPAPATAGANKPAPQGAPRAEPAPPKAAAAKLSFKEKRELESLPGRIEALETEQRDLATRLANPDLYRQGADAVRQINERAAAVETELAEAFVRWEALEAKSGQG